MAMARPLLFLVGMRVVVLTSVLVGCTFNPAAPNAQDDAQGSNGGPTIPLSYCHSNAPDLRLCLDFEDTSLSPEIKDLSTGGHDGSTYDLDVTVRESQQAAAFHWDSFVDVPESADLDIPRTVTIEMWVSPTDSSDSYPFANTGQYDINISSSHLVCDFGGHNVQTEDMIPTHTWTHVACTYDGNTMKAYINGDLSKCRMQQGMPIPIPSFDLGISIGGGYTGALDDVHVYARTLDPTQIQALAGVSGGNTQCH